MTGTVLTEDAGDGVRVLTLNRPERLNAINATLLEDLIAALHQANRDAAVRAVVLTGAGRAFCAGDDLKEFGAQAGDTAATRAYIERIQDVTRAIIGGDKPVVGAIRGWAVGGGLEWVINCDFAVAAEGTRFFFPETALGVFVTGGVTALLPRIVGLQRARELIMLGERFDAAQAQAWGLVWKVVADGEVLPAALATARRIAALPPGPVRDLRRILARHGGNLDDALAAETGGFAPAARRLGLSPPAATRAIAALEDRIGARLLHRTTRIVRLTEAGSRFLADAKRILGELEEAEASAAGAHAEPRGLLTVTAPVMFGTRHVAPVLLDFLAQHPLVTARTMLADRVVDLLEEGIDVAVRIAHLPDSSLSALRVGSVRRVVVASPDYLDRRGTPKRPAELARHEAIAFTSVSAEPSWSFHVDGKIETISPPAQLAVNSAEVAVAAAVAGRGLTRVLSYQAAPEVLSGKLKIVLARYEPPPIPIHIVHPEGRHANARVRAFVDFAVARLRADKSLN